MVTTKRQNLILEKIIEEYIGSAKPISSQLLEKRYDFGVCPATIRIEMQKLTDEGFLYQPHTSAGRVPTDRAYRFFVDKLFEEGLPDLKENLRLGDWLEGEIEDSLKFIQTITKNLALASSNLALSYLFNEKIFWKEGWEEILQEPEFQKTDFISSFTKLLKNFEKELEGLKLDSGIKVYIGKENPFSRARDFSIIISQCHFAEEEKGIISLLGPKRMAYDKNIALINSFKNILERL